jgi:hypothetical protein
MTNVLTRLAAITILVAACAPSAVAAASSRPPVISSVAVMPMTPLRRHPVGTIGMVR